VLEIVEVEGCRYYGTVLSERVIDRIFPENADLNEMERLAFEAL